MIKFLLTSFLISPFLLYAQFGAQQVIDETNVLSPWSISVADIDGDGYLDVLSASSTDDTLAWYKNLDGLGTFGEKQIITSFLDETRFITGADIDNDGDIDVLATALFVDLVVWYENLDGLGNFSSQQIISNNLLLPLMVSTADLDGDGDLDIIIPSKADNKITWLENTNGQGTFGPQQIISNTSLTPSSVFIADIDGDGDGDIISESSINNFPCWYENLDGLGDFGPQQEITQDTFGSQYIIAGDVDNDGDIDVLGLEAGGNTIAWYENTDGLGTFGPKQIITTEVNSPRQLFMADFDNDGDKDVVYNSQGAIIEKLAWQANDGEGNFGPQQLIFINTNNNIVIALRGLFAADVDNDGDIDVFSSSIGDSKIAWYENLTILGIEESLQQKISLHPNPANSIINITNTSNYTIKQITIYNLLGTPIKQVKGNVSQINIEELPSGVYFVNLETEKGSVTKKMMKE